MEASLSDAFGSEKERLHYFFFLLWGNNILTIQSLVFCCPSVYHVNWGHSPPFRFPPCRLDEKALHCFVNYLSLGLRAEIPCHTLAKKVLGARERSGCGEQLPNVMIFTGRAWTTAMELAFLGSGQSLVLLPLPGCQSICTCRCVPQVVACV